MVTAKRAITSDVLSAQGAFELPQRQLLALVTVVITNLLNNLNVDVDVKNNNVAVQVCAVLGVLAEIGAPFRCDIQQ
jgi:hypothetical protein